jgi:ribose-phosphate pyrophosphokinase
LPAGHTPVLLDDIASSGHTMAAAIGQLREHGAAAPVCIVVHALFAGDALAVLERAGPARVVSCNTIVHATNAVDISKPLAQAAALLQLAQRNEEAR